MTVRQYTTSKQRLTVTINKHANGSYEAYEIRTRGEGGNTAILRAWSLGWLADTLQQLYPGETLIREF